MQMLKGTILTLQVETIYEYTGIPPRCRKPREYTGKEICQFEIRELLEDPPLALETHIYNFSEEDTIHRYYWINKHLYKLHEQSFQEWKENLQASNLPSWPKEHVTMDPDIHVLSNNIDSVVERFKEQLNDLIVWGNSLLEKAKEPVYSGSNTFHGSSLSVTECYQEGQDNIYRADQLEEAKATYGESRDHIVVHMPHVLQAKKNPGRIQIDKTGESAQSIFQKFKALIEYKPQFEPFLSTSKEGEKYYSSQLFAPSSELKGLWKPLVTKTGETEVRVILYPAKEKLQGSYITILKLCKLGHIGGRWSEANDILQKLSNSAYPKEELEKWKSQGRYTPETETFEDNFDFQAENARAETEGELLPAALETE